MYLNFFGLEREPFHITPDPEFLYLSPSHKEAFASVIYGVERRKGFVTLTGEVGTGKTTILRAYLKRIEQNTAMRPLYLFNSDLQYDELLRILGHELGVDADGLESAELLEKLHGALIEEFRQNRNVILLIDEAQNMPVETLERLRMLSNLETSKEKLLQIILVGQPELERKLRTPALRQLRQRIVMHGRLQPLTRQESLGYITHRLNQARAYTAEVFSPGALREIVKRARGNPRVLNILCDNALITAFGEERRPVPARIVRTVWCDIEGPPRRRWIPIAAVPLLALAVLALIFAYYGLPGTLALHGISAQASAPRADVHTTISPESPAAPASIPDDPPAPQLTPHVEATVPPMAGPPTPAAPAACEPVAGPPEPVPAIVERLAPQAPVLPPADEDAHEAVRVVASGDCLTHLISNVYGACTDSRIAAVLRANPTLANPNRLAIGERIVFPVLDTRDGAFAPFPGALANHDGEPMRP